MNDFILGASCSLLMIPFFLLVLYICRLLPSEFSLASIGVMIIGDGVIAVSWSHVFGESVNTGIAIAFLIATLFKVIFLVSNPITRKMLEI